MKIDHNLIQKLIIEATEVRKNAYVPYSKFQVGAALLSDSQKIYRGANIENASFGLTCCAERTAIFTALSDGMKYIKVMTVIADTPKPVSMCGACRQVAVEFMREESLIICTNIKNPQEHKTWTAAQLLPAFFRSSDF